MTAPGYADVLTALGRAHSVLLTAHVQPDGDAIGSLLTMYEYVLGLGKDVRMILQDAVPENLRFLPFVGRIEPADAVFAEAPDLAISVDASDAERLGLAHVTFYRAKQTVQMDHHRTNTRFAAVNVVREEASSSGVVVYDLLRAAGVSVTQTMAVNLYTAISTDTTTKSGW